MMTDQTPDAPHPFASLLRTMEAAAHVGEPVARDVRAFATDAANRLASLPDATIHLDGTVNGPADRRILDPAPAPRKCKAWINVRALYDSPLPAGLPDHRLYCQVPAGEPHSVIIDPNADERASGIVHRAKSIWWAARSTPEDDDD